MNLNSKLNNSIGFQAEGGQALVGGLILLSVVLFFSIYFLSVSESFLRMFSNAEGSNSAKVREMSTYAHILNEISINNQNIIAAMTVSENALLRSLEYGLYISYHQPYWDTYAILKQKNKSPTILSNETKKTISAVFQSYSLTSARGFFIAKSLSEKNKLLIQKLPRTIRSYFTESTNSQVNCFALETEKKYYQKPGILNLNDPYNIIYQFYMHRAGKNNCSIEHKDQGLNKFINRNLSNFYPNEVDSILDYTKLENLSSGVNSDYGIQYVDVRFKKDFILSLNFYTSNSTDKLEKEFTAIGRFLSKIKPFKSLDLLNKENLLRSPMQNLFMITHKLSYCSPNKRTICNISDQDFLRSFFTANWTVTGVYP